jgi:hypothetical protein
MGKTVQIVENDHAAHRHEASTKCGGSGAALCGLALICLIFHVPVLGDWFTLTPDGITYLQAARTFAQTGSLPPEHLTAPVGFVALLAPPLLFGEAPWLAIQIVFLIASIATALLTYQIARTYLTPTQSFMAAILMTSSTVLLRLETTLLSETIFIPLSLLTLQLMTRWRDSPGHRLQFWTGLSAAATICVRSIGFLLPIIGVWQILRRSPSGWKPRLRSILIFTLPTLLATTAWETRQARFTVGKTYSADWFQARGADEPGAPASLLFAKRFIRLVPQRMAEIKACIVPQRIAWRLFQPPLSQYASWCVGLLMLSMAFIRAWRISGPIDFYFMGTFLILCFWPWNEGDRFMAPLIPIFFIYLVTVIRRITLQFESWINPSRSFTTITVLIVALFLGEWALFCKSAPDYQAKARSTLLRMRQIGSWLEQQIPPTAGLVCITRQASNEKTVAMGAAYFANRSITSMVDIAPGKVARPFSGPDFTLIETSVLDTRNRLALPMSDAHGFRLIGPSSK